MATGINIGEMFVRLSADTGQLQTGMRAAETSMKRFGTAAQQSAVNLNRLRGPLTSLATQEQARNGPRYAHVPVATQMAAASALTLGVLAGVGAIAAHTGC